MKKNLVFVLALAVLWGCQQKKNDLKRVSAVLNATQGNNASGQVDFFPSNGRVLVKVQIQGLAPNTTHGFHVHENGDCSSPDASSAGAHFNPLSMPHAGPTDPQSHMGDLGNVQSDAAGMVNVEVTRPDLKIEGPHSIIGKAVVLHASPDDLTSQPAGNAGARIACGVVKSE